MGVACKTGNDLSRRAASYPGLPEERMARPGHHRRAHGARTAAYPARPSVPTEPGRIPGRAVVAAAGLAGRKPPGQELPPREIRHRAAVTAPAAGEGLEAVIAAIVIIVAVLVLGLVVPAVH